MSNAKENPLLDVAFEVPFDRIRAEHIVPAVEHHLSAARSAVEEIKAGPSPGTYESTLEALEKATEPLEWTLSVAGHLESVATYPELRAAWNAVQEPVSVFRAGIPLDADLWRAIKEYAATDEAGGLAGARARHLEKVVDEFRRQGADLDDAGKRRLEKIEVAMAKLTTRFSENVLDSTNDFELLITDEAKLAGLPERVKDAARENASGKGVEGWRFTLQAPSYVPLMTYLDDSSIREQVYRAFSTRATEGDRDNRPLVADILKLRREKAALLGYEQFGDLVLEDRMAKKADVSISFVEDLRRKTLPFFERENREIEEFRLKRVGPEAPPMQPWDLAYWAEKQRLALYDLDPEELRPYFEFERCLEGAFEIAARLFGVRAEPRPDMPTWDPDVRAYALLDHDDSLLGAFYVDPFPRESKRGGAWMNSLITGTAGPRGCTPHLGLFCGNFNPPAGGRPALLDHGELKTLFHEFGHLLHHLVSKVEVRSLAGANVAWDFVEMPSQIMEGWTWEREPLDAFARHYETGSPLPEDLLGRMVRARDFRAANAMMRQLGFAAMDLGLHVDYDPEKDGDAVAWSRAILDRYSPVPLPEYHSMVSGFQHLFSDPVGYAAGYYSYKWAEVLAADAFGKFLEQGLLDPETGRAFRERVLARGDSAEPMELFVDFMGREPRPEALLERSGLV